MLLYWVSYFVIMARPTGQAVKGTENIQENTSLIGGAQSRMYIALTCVVEQSIMYYRIRGYFRVIKTSRG